MRNRIRYFSCWVKRFDTCSLSLEKVLAFNLLIENLAQLTSARGRTSGCAGQGTERLEKTSRCPVKACKRWRQNARTWWGTGDGDWSGRGVRALSLALLAHNSANACNSQQPIRLESRTPTSVRTGGTKLARREGASEHWRSERAVATSSRKNSQTLSWEHASGALN